MYCSSCAAELPSFPPVTCSTCGTSHWPNSKPCAGALLSRGGKVLLVRRANQPWRGYWDIPGGFCDVDEHPVDAAVREVREETGLECTVVGFIGIWMDSYGPAGPGLPDVVTLNIYYHADLVGPDEPRPDPAEVAEVKWFAPDELPRPADTAFPSQQVPVLQAWKLTATRGLPRTTEMVDRLSGVSPVGGCG